MYSNTEKTYSIGDAEKMTGVSQRMLRAWEGKHIPFPERIVCGDRAYRRYSQSEIRLISRIKFYRDEGYTLPMAVQKSEAELTGKGGGSHA